MLLKNTETKKQRKLERERKLLERYRRLGKSYEYKQLKEKQNKRKRKLQKKSESESDDDDYEGDEPKKKRKRKNKKKKKRGEENLRQFEKFSTGSDENDEGLEAMSDDFEDYSHQEDIDRLLDKSDHEFSCESDVPENEVKMVKHARTAPQKRKRGRPPKQQQDEPMEEEEDEEDEDDFACKKCGKSDHPEWILLCDKCDIGWHASCLRPPLMVIPEGDWYCPDCQHAKLLESLESSLAAYEILYKSKKPKSNVESG